MIEITSFGYLHDEVPANLDLTLDARDLIRDPHVDPALRQMTGRDAEVQNAVMGTPGAEALVALLVQAATALDVIADGDGWVRVAVGGQSGRHRSVVLAEAVGTTLSLQGHEVQIYHRDIDQPVMERSGSEVA
jgi:RNase adaptor protein for sRNA GlmZ degradation